MHVASRAGGLGRGDGHTFNPEGYDRDRDCDCDFDRYCYDPYYLYAFIFDCYERPESTRGVGES